MQSGKTERFSCHSPDTSRLLHKASYNRDSRRIPDVYMPPTRALGFQKLDDDVVIDGNRFQAKYSRTTAEK